MKLSVFLLVFLLVQSPFCKATQTQFALVTEESDEIIIQSGYYQDADGLAIDADDKHTIILMKATAGKRMQDLPYQHEVIAAAHQTALTPALLHAVIATESGHKLRALSPKGAFGLMQLMPATARALNVGPLDSADRQILAGATYLKRLLNDFDGNLTLALAAYNAGPTAVKKYQNRVPPYEETQQYVRRVYQHLKTYTYHY
jgi:soluble lytic murein transglycosylase-like protein